LDDRQLSRDSRPRGAGSHSNFLSFSLGRRVSSWDHPNKSGILLRPKHGSVHGSVLESSWIFWVCLERITDSSRRKRAVFIHQRGRPLLAYKTIVFWTNTITLPSMGCHMLSAAYKPDMGKKKSWVELDGGFWGPGVDESFRGTGHQLKK